MARIIGQPVTGWKLGATSPAMRRLAGHDGPIIGRVFESVTFSSPARLPAARFPEARVECEFAFRLTEGLAPRPAPWTVGELATKVELYAALEIIGNRYPKATGAFELTTDDEIADNGAGIGFVFGPPLRGWRALDLQNLEIELRVDGGAPARNFLGEDRCVPLQALGEAADILSARGIALKPGMYVSTGAATVPQPVWPGARVPARFAPGVLVEAHFVP
jgi:2-keto-4-pentenoate hydratase